MHVIVFQFRRYIMLLKKETKVKPLSKLKATLLSGINVHFHNILTNVSMH